MREAFARAIVDAALADERVVVLTGDHGYALFDEFRKRCTSQYINAGIAEQNMVGVAAGLAKAGYLPIVYGLSAFVPVRVLEQIKIDICYEELPVMLVGDGAGLVYSTLGASHQSFEDVACLRALPHIDIFSPCDGLEMVACMAAARAKSGPTYLRMGKTDLGTVHNTPLVLNRGGLLQINHASGAIGIIASGSMVHTALQLAREIDAPLWSAPWLKPLDEVQLNTIAQRCTALITLEEHSIQGGLGSCVLEGLALTTPRPTLRLGIGQQFSLTCGNYNHALKEHGLDLDTLRAEIAAFAFRQAKLTRA